MKLSFIVSFAKSSLGHQWLVCLFAYLLVGLQDKHKKVPRPYDWLRQFMSVLLLVLLAPSLVKTFGQAKQYWILTGLQMFNTCFCVYYIYDDFIQDKISGEIYGYVRYICLWKLIYLSIFLLSSWQPQDSYISVLKLQYFTG
jgi:L-asparagine transporter-like permease